MSVPSKSKSTSGSLVRSLDRVSGMRRTTAVFPSPNQRFAKLPNAQTSAKRSHGTSSASPARRNFNPVRNRFAPKSSGFMGRGNGLCGWLGRKRMPLRPSCGRVDKRAHLLSEIRQYQTGQPPTPGDAGGPSWPRSRPPRFRVQFHTRRLAEVDLRSSPRTPKWQLPNSTISPIVDRLCWLGLVGNRRPRKNDNFSVALPA